MNVGHLSNNLICSLYFLRKYLAFTTFLILLFLNAGCYFSSHSFNHGRLVNPGDIIHSFSVGSYRSNVKLTTNDWVLDSVTDDYINKKTYDTITTNWLSLHYQYRLGVHNKYPFGGGIEIGIQFEGSFCFYREYDTSYFNNGIVHDSDIYEYTNVYAETPPSVEFDIRMGFKPLVLSRSIYNHNLQIGWTVGTWVDNGWYIEYAGGWEGEKIIPYTSLRVQLCATDVFSKGGLYNDNFFSIKDNALMIRNALGCSIKTYKKGRAKIIPDYIAPEISLCYPNFLSAQQVGLTYHLGFRWTNGF